jgi:hypothetical protein
MYFSRCIAYLVRALRYTKSSYGNWLLSTHRHRAVHTVVVALTVSNNCNLCVTNCCYAALQWGSYALHVPASGNVATLLGLNNLYVYAAIAHYYVCGVELEQQYPAASELLSREAYIVKVTQLPLKPQVCTLLALL